MVNRKMGVLVVVLLLAVPSFSAGEGGLKWFSVKEGMEKAKAEKKPLIVDFFYGKGCPRCENLQKNVYDNPAIAKKIMDDFVPVRIDLTGKLTPEEEALGNKFDFKMDCLLLFMDHEGKVFEDSRGKRMCFIDSVDPDWFVEYLKQVKEAHYGK